MKPPTESLRLSDLARQFVAEGAARGLSPQTQAAYGVALLRLLKFLGRRDLHELPQIRHDALVDWVVFVRTHRHPRRGRIEPTPYSPHTIQHYLSIAARFFGWLVRKGILLVDPWEGFSWGRVGADPVASLAIPSEIQMRTLLEIIPGDGPLSIRDRAVVELMYSSGLRNGEVQRLNVADVDLEGGWVRIRQGKGRKDRVVPLGRPAGRALVCWLDAGRPQLVHNRAEPALFLTQDGRRLGPQTLGVRLRKLRRPSGLDHLRAHHLRHASAVHMLRHGADLRALQEFLGHAQLTTVQVYTRLAPDDLKTMHQKTHPRERHKDRT